jgi:DNA-damage-inducible protein D
MGENKVASKQGGGISKKARVELEEKTKKKIVTGNNYLPEALAEEGDL